MPEGFREASCAPSLETCWRLENPFIRMCGRLAAGILTIALDNSVSPDANTGYKKILLQAG